MAIIELFRLYLGSSEKRHYHPEVEYFLRENVAEIQKTTAQHSRKGDGCSYWNFITGAEEKIDPHQ